MIGNFEIQRPSLNLNESISNFSDLSGITSLLLVERGTYLSLANALILNSWISLIPQRKLFSIHRIIDVEDNSEEPRIVESKQNFRYQASMGKYRFTCKLNADIDYFVMLKKYEGQLLDAYFGDANGNIIGVKDGSDIKPFTVDSIFVKKISLGVFGQSSLIGINIELGVPTEINSGYSFKPEFSINSIVCEEVFISNITSEDVYTVNFDLFDYCGSAISTLSLSDISMIDEISGELTSVSLTNNGGGNYSYETAEAQYKGKLNISSNSIFGSGTYEFFTPDFNPLEFSSDFKIS